MSIAEDKANSGYECSSERLQEVKDDIKTIKTHAKWVMSLLAAIALGLASFVFTDIGELPIIYKELSKPELLIKVFAGLLFISYFLFIAFFMPLLLWRQKPHPNNEAKGLKARIEESHRRLIVIDKRLKRLIVLSVSSPFVNAILATYFTYFV